VGERVKVRAREDVIEIWLLREHSTYSFKGRGNAIQETTVSIVTNLLRGVLLRLLLSVLWLLLLLLGLSVTIWHL
jgi:hypothetical protein